MSLLLGAAGVLVGRAADVEAPTPVPGTVIAHRLNVRAKPGLQFEVVCQLPKDTVVQVVREEREWLGITAPDEAAAWVAADAMKDGTVMARITRVYAGAGTLFSAYGTFRRGDKVTVLRTREGKWALVRPPGDAVVWVHRDYIRLPKGPPPPGAGEPEEERAAAGEAAAAAAAPPAAEAPKHPRIHRIPLAVEPHEVTFIGDAKPVVRRGIVVPLGSEDSQWAYALAVLVDDTYYPLAYLGRATVGLDRWKWQTVVVTGTKRWVKGWPRPLIQVDRLEAATAAAEPPPRGSDPP